MRCIRPGSVGLVLLAGAALAACQGDETDEERQGACGDVSEHTVVLLAKVVDGEDAPVDGATVEVVDRGWEPGTVLGTGATDASGEVEIGGLEVTSVEDCWGTLLDYYLVVSLDEREAEKQINPALFNAIDGGSGRADIRSTPVTLP